MFSPRVIPFLAEKATGANKVKLPIISNNRPETNKIILSGFEFLIV